MFKEIARMHEQVREEVNKQVQDTMLQKISLVVGKEVNLKEAEELLRSKKVKVTMYGAVGTPTYYMVKYKERFTSYKVEPKHADGIVSVEVTDLTTFLGSIGNMEETIKTDLKGVK